MKPTINVKRVKDAALMEIYKSGTLVKMALLAKVGSGYRQLHSLVLCKDFICDIYNSSFRKEDIKLYGMQWYGTTNSPEWESLNLLVQFVSEKQLEDFKVSILHLQNIEGLNNIPVTEVYETDAKDELVLVADRAWLTNILRLSLYLTLVRVLSSQCFKEPDWISKMRSPSNIGPDAHMIRSIPEGTLEAVLSDLNILTFPDWVGYDRETNYRTIHHNAGFISVFGLHQEVCGSKVMKNEHWKQITAAGIKTWQSENNVRILEA